MYVEHPYKFNDKFYAKVDGKFYEITREVAKAMLSAYRNEVYRSKKWQPEDPETMTRKQSGRSCWIVFSVRIQMELECRTYQMRDSGA